MDFLGSVAGGALGYIHGNVRGARLGYKVGKYLSQSKMHIPYPTPTKSVVRIGSKKKGKKSAGKGFSKKRKNSNPFLVTTTPNPSFPYPKKRKVAHASRGMEVVHGSMMDEKMRISRSKKRGKLLRIDKGRWHYSQNYSNLLVSNAGVQSFNTIAFTTTASQIITSTGAAYGTAQNLTALEQLNPYLTNTGSVLIPSTVTPLTDQFYILNVTITVEMTNISNVGIYCDLDVWQCKKLTNSDVSTLWIQGETNEGNGVPVGTLPPPGVSAGPNAGTPNVQYVGTKPTDVKLVRDFWKKVGAKEVFLSADSTLKLTIHIRMHKCIKCEDIRQYLTQPSNFIPGSTFCVTTLHRGAIVADKTTALNPIATYGTTELGIITTVKYDMAPVRGNAGRLNEQYMADRVPSGTTIANQSTLNQVDNVTGVVVAG